MRRLLLLLALLFAVPAQAQIWQDVEFGDKPKVQRFTHMGATVTLTPVVEEILSPARALSSPLAANPRPPLWLKGCALAGKWA